MKVRISNGRISQSRIIAIFCCLAFALCLVSCGSAGNPNSASSSSSAGSSSSASSSSSSDSKPSNTLENDEMKVEGVYIDESYAGSKAGDEIKRLYVFTTVTPSSGTQKVSSASFTLSAAREKATDELDSMDVIQNDTESGSELARLASSYTCTNVITEVTPGSSAKLIIPFNVPAYYLQDGASFSLSDSNKVSDGIKFGFDAIKDADSKNTIAQSIDSEGYAAAMKAREDASPETAQDVRDKLNGYEYFESKGGVTQRYSFEGDRFTAKAMGQEVSGQYAVKNGYLACTQDSTGWVNWIPWEYSEKNENGISIDIGALYVEK